MAVGGKIFLDTHAAIITRNKSDYAGSEIPVLSPDEFLAMRESSAE